MQIPKKGGHSQRSSFIQANNKVLYYSSKLKPIQIPEKHKQLKKINTLPKIDDKIKTLYIPSSVNAIYSDALSENNHIDTIIASPDLIYIDSDVYRLMHRLKSITGHVDLFNWAPEILQISGIGISKYGTSNPNQYTVETIGLRITIDSTCNCEKLKV